MKLSNKILIAFFGFIFVYLTAAFTELRVRGVSNLLDPENSKSETIDISGVKQLIVHDLKKHVYVIGSDRSELEVRSNSGDLLKKLKYRLSGEKLTLESLDITDDEAIRISLYVPSESLQWITTDGAAVSISGLEQPVLNVSQKNGWIMLGEENHIGKLTLQSSAAYFSMRNSTLDSLMLTMNNADVSMESHVKFLEGNLRDTSYLRMYGIDEILVKKDETSRLYVD